MQTVQFTETALRDASQSLIATRLAFDDFEPILKTMDEAGYYSLECWGGATFDVCLRFLNEDPWERLRKIREACPNTKLQMLLRGQNLLGYKHYSDDIVRRFVRASIRNGIDVLRVFDALNDPTNLKVAIEETLENGGIASGTICYTTSPVHTLEKYVAFVKELEAMGVSTISIKDMAGIMSPAQAYDLVSAIKDATDLPVAVHTHCTTGLAFMTYLKAVEAGADIIDTAVSPLSGGTSQPSTETLLYTLKELGYDVQLDSAKVSAISDFFKPVRAKYLENGTLNPISLTTDTKCLDYQIPGGMLSNLLSQLNMMNASDRFEEVLIETPKVRADMGYPPLVTPLSQMVGTQAVQNVLAGERYKMVGKEIKAYCRGEYGAFPAPLDEEVYAKVMKGLEPVEGRYAETLPADLYETTAAELGETARCEEDVLSYISFPQVAEKYFEWRDKPADQKITGPLNYTIERM